MICRYGYFYVYILYFAKIWKKRKNFVSLDVIESHLPGSFKWFFFLWILLCTSKKLLYFWLQFSTVHDNLIEEMKRIAGRIEIIWWYLLVGATPATTATSWITIPLTLRYENGSYKVCLLVMFFYKCIVALICV